MSETETADLWWHLLNDHGMSLTALHGNPRAMHAAGHALPGVADHTHPTTPEGGDR